MEKNISLMGSLTCITARGIKHDIPQSHLTAMYGSFGLMSFSQTAYGAQAPREGDEDQRAHTIYPEHGKALPGMFDITSYDL